MLNTGDALDNLEELEATSNYSEPGEQLKTFFILNPVAGTTDAEQAAELIQSACSSRSLDYRIHKTSKGEDISPVVADALSEGYQRFAALGGDGTVAMVAACLVGRNIPLGIMPGGSGNVLAKELAIPIDIAASLELLLDSPKIRILDGMLANGKYYFLNVGAGVSSLTTKNTRREDKRKFGLVAYLWRGLEQIVRYSPRRFRVIADGEEYRYRASEVMVVNASIMGAPPFKWSPDIEPDDRSLEVCIITARKLKEVPRFMLDVLLDRQESSPYINCVPVRKEVYLDVSNPLPVQGDGEIIGTTPVKVAVIPAALHVIVPAS